MNENQLIDLVNMLAGLPSETEWVERKENYADPNDIGEYISALSNSAALLGRDRAYIVWGVKDETGEIVGTSFKPNEAKAKGNQLLPIFLVQKLDPVPTFHTYEFNHSAHRMVLIEIRPINYRPVLFDGQGYIRVGTSKTSLRKYPEKERQLWNLAADRLFEQEIAKEKVTADEVLKLLDYPVLFDLCGEALPAEKDGIMSRLQKDHLVVDDSTGHYNITNLGALLFAKNLSLFERLQRKAVRVIQYKGDGRVQTLQEQAGNRGYAAGFDLLLSYLSARLPSNEVIGKALRKEIPMYPELAIRELVANALIHQDLTLSGTSPMIEIFDGRLEISNPGAPLMDTLRLIDTHPRSRNEMMASLMRKLKICEERGTGIDKVVDQVEFFQLPAPEFQSSDNHMRVTLFAHKTLNEMDRNDKIRACYQHACLQHVTHNDMTNTTLRARFGIEDKNYSTASRIIADTVSAGLIKDKDPASESKKHAKYVPFWASR